MSSTRTNQDGEFKQERWASSSALDRALKANLVAARCSTLESAEQREAIWFLQYLSQHPGGLAWAASEVAPNFIASEDRETYLAAICLDPAQNQELSASCQRSSDRWPTTRASAAKASPSPRSAARYTTRSTIAASKNA
jgi:hypothetical protein